MGGADGSRAREGTQSTACPGMAHSTFKSLFGTRSKKSQMCDQGPKTPGFRQQRGQDASRRARLGRSSEDRRGTRGAEQVVRVPVTKQAQKAFDESHLMNLNLQTRRNCARTVERTC